jgi:tetratricopeptide (TPR) repeat protein
MKKLRSISDFFLLAVSILGFSLPDDILRMPHSARIIITCLAFLLFLIPKIWSTITKKIKYFLALSRVIRIGISIEESRDRELVDYCNQEISRLGMSSRINFKKISFDKNRPDKVQNIVISSNVDVVAWSPKIKNSKGKVSLIFTYKNTSNNLIAKIVHSEMSSLVSQERMFNLNHESFHVDLNLEKTNIANFALYIVALCTTVFRGNKDGIWVFEKLKERVRAQGGLLEQNVLMRLQDLYFIKGSDLLSKNKYKESLVYLEKALAVKPERADILAGVALAKFLTGDELGAEKISDALLQNNTGHPIAHLDGAFFRVKNKKYTAALRHYLLFSRTSPNPALCLDAIAFISNRLDENPKEFGYLFARGFLKRLLNRNPKFTDVGESNYVEDFEVFIQRADKNTYKEMIKVAEKYLLRVK